jgi:hypothetical protein
MKFVVLKCWVGVIKLGSYKLLKKKCAHSVRVRNKHCKLLVFLHHIKYRVSIKYFPNYKHLLQENYVEYKRSTS